MAMTIEATEAAGLEPGNYTGIVKDIVEQDGTYNGEPTEQYKFVIEVDGETKADGSAVEQWAYCNRILSAQSKLWGWVQAVSGRPPVVGQGVDLEDIFLNKRIGFTMGINKTGRCVVMSLTKARGEAAPAPKPAAPGQGAAEEAADACSVEGCSDIVDKYTKKGRPLCASHTAEDL